MKQNTAPFWTALKGYKAKRVIPFHTPGHKLRGGPFTDLADTIGEGFFHLDPSDEVENPEINHDFEEALAQAQELAAELFGAQDSLFLVNGTTGGLHYFLMPLTGPVLIPRFSHQAVYSALMLAEGSASYLETNYDPDWLIPLPPSGKECRKKLETGQYQALVLTNPTYYGSVPPLQDIIQTAKAKDMLVFVDEAHGGHFNFSDKFPPSALKLGADGVVQSTHKTLGSFTQTSMLHSNNREWFNKVKQAKQVLETTSPSLVFLAALDEVRRVLALRGFELLETTLELAERCENELGKIPGVEVLPQHLRNDRTKIVFSLRELGLTGIEVEALLRNEYNIQVELSDYYNILALITLGDTEGTIEKLIAAVEDLAARKRHLARKPLPRHTLALPPIPTATYQLREAFFHAKEEVPLNEAAGRISGGFLTPYPPGVPVIVPGEEFSPEIIEYLLWCKDLGWPVRGMNQGEKVTVLKDNNRFCRKIV